MDLRESPKKTPKGDASSADREARLAAALRTNLRRRKASQKPADGEKRERIR